MRGIRCVAIVAVVLVAAWPLAAEESAASKKLLLLSQGPDGHPEGTHEYQQGMDVLAGLLSDQPGLMVRRVQADNPWTEGPDLLDAADGAVLFLSEGAKWIDSDAARRAAFQRLAARQGGLAVFHWAMGTRDAQPIDNFVALFGGCHGGPDRKYKVLTTELTVAAADHPALAGIRSFEIRDEFYYRLKMTAEPKLVPLLTARIDDRQETVCWAWQRPDGGRSFGFSGCHFHDNWQRGEYRQLAVQGIRWTIGDVSR